MFQIDPNQVDKFFVQSLITIDRDTALERMGNMKELYIQVMSEFVNIYATAAELLGSIPEEPFALKEHNRFVHTLKGVSGTIMAEPLHRVLIEYDAALKAREPREVLVAIADQAVEAFSALMDELSPYIKS